MNMPFKVICILVLAGSWYSCGDNVPAGSVIPFADVVGSYSGLCRQQMLPAEIFADSIQTNMSVSAATLSTAQFQSGCITEGRIILTYSRTSGDSILFSGIEGQAYYLQSTRQLEVVAFSSDEVHTWYSGSK